MPRGGEVAMFVKSPVYHLVRPGGAGLTVCGAYLARAYRARDGSEVRAYEGGTPFPEFASCPSGARRLCASCAERAERLGTGEGE